MSASTEVSPLLARLAVASRQHLFTADSWASHLGDDSEAQSFAEQLRREWLPFSVPDDFCREMMNFARDYVDGYGSWPHLWSHTLRVTGTALALAPEADIPPEHAFLMGIFHDISKLDEMNGGESHEEVGAEVFREAMQGHFPTALVNLIVNVIAKRTSPVNPYTQVLFDADKLDKIGATGIARRISTDWGSQHIRFALGRVQDDAADFPEMHFPTSKKLADLKLIFTSEFLDTNRSRGT
jgi:putative nucleotidyltransferase with HDIG domain